MSSEKEQLEDIRIALEAAAKRFREYETHHRARYDEIMATHETESMKTARASAPLAKAESNASMAARLETLLASNFLVKSIEESPDWATIGSSYVDGARAMAGGYIESAAKSGSAGAPGMAMRGICLALADGFAEPFLERGMASTMRGVRNAFAQRRLELAAKIDAPPPVFPDMAAGER